MTTMTFQTYNNNNNNNNNHNYKTNNLPKIWAQTKKEYTTWKEHNKKETSYNLQTKWTNFTKTKTKNLMNSVKNRQIKPPINTTKTNLIIKNNKIPDQTLKCKNTSPWNNSKPKESKTIKESSVLKYIFLYTYKNLFIIYFFKKKKF